MIRRTTLALALLAGMATSLNLAGPLPAAANGSQLEAVKQAKVLAHIARARARGELAPGARGPGEECQTGALEIGNVNVGRGGIVPREVVVVVEGDVINVNGQVARPGC